MFLADDPAGGNGWPFLSVDAAFGEVVGDEFVRASVWGGHDRFPLADALPLKSGPFDGISVGLATDSVAVYSRKYGPDRLGGAAGVGAPHRDADRHPRVRVPMDRIRRLTGG